MSSTPFDAARPVRLREDAGVIGLVGAAHLISHFSQLLLAPLFPWLKDAFGVSYTQLGLLMTIFFVVSCTVQAASGFLVDRYGPRSILFAGLALLGAAAFGFATAPTYHVLGFWSVVAGIGNAVFHPVDYTLLNRKVSTPRLGHAYSVHGMTGSLGWALAPALLVPLTVAYSWRVAIAAAGVVTCTVLAVLVINRDKLVLPTTARHPASAAGARQESGFSFLRIPAVWMCFWFFMLWSMILTAVQAYAPQAARFLHDVPVALAAMCLTVYMLCSASGTLVGGFLASDPQRCDKIVAASFITAAVLAIVMAYADLPALGVPVLFGILGLLSGIAGPSRDMLVKRSTPEHASGRVYGVVYSGLDVGQSIAPLIFGYLMDRQDYRGVWLAVVVIQILLITSAVNVRKVRRTVAVAA